MANKKNKKKEETKVVEEILPCEWVVQFDDDEPQRLAYADETSTLREVIITLPNNSDSFVNFIDSKTNKSFKIFARKPL